MSEIENLRRTISGCRYQIAQIQEDIKSMKEEQRVFRGYATIFAENKRLVGSYDMTVGDTWRKNLCDVAQVKQKAVEGGVGEAVSACSTIVTDLNNCIAKAEEMIEELYEKIRSCEERIEQILEEERRASQNQ